MVHIQVETVPQKDHAFLHQLHHAAVRTVVTVHPKNTRCQAAQIQGKFFPEGDRRGGNVNLPAALRPLDQNVLPAELHLLSLLHPLRNGLIRPGQPLLKRILIMGGSAVKGNTTPAAEFNVYADPHAAQLVFKSGVPIVMCALDVTMSAYLTPEEVADLGQHDSPVCRFFHESTKLPLAFLERGGQQTGLCLHDACPVVFLTHPQLFQGQEAGVFVETQSTFCNGKTVTDLWSDKKFPVKNTFVVLDVDRPAFVDLVQKLMLSY